MFLAVRDLKEDIGGFLSDNCGPYDDFRPMDCGNRGACFMPCVELTFVHPKLVSVDLYFSRRANKLLRISLIPYSLLFKTAS